MSTKQTLTAIVLLIIIAVGAYFLFQGDAQPQENGQNTTPNENMQDNGDTGDNTQNGGAMDAGDTSPGDSSSADMDKGGDASTDEVTVTYTDNGFEPASVTVSPGTTVTFVNESGGNMWVGSDVHPTHTEYAGSSLNEHCPDTSGTAFDQCETGDTYSFTFEKSGEWGYHNHVRSSDTGTVVVE